MPSNLKEASSKESSITVTVRVRPFTATENARITQKQEESQILGDGAFSSNVSAVKDRNVNRYPPKGIRKIINVVDDRMLIFDPEDNNPISTMQRNLFPRSNSRIREHRFTFDRLFDEDATQDDVYNNTTRPLLASVLEGYNATVFAYGATGCGKTHTISGTPQNPGIIYATVQELFERLEHLRDTKTIEVSVSYLEIYNETIRDLLCPDIESKLLIIREDANSRISVRNLSSHTLTTVEEVMDLLITGNKNRTVNSTEANATSSRSHAVLQINIDQRDRTRDLQEEHYFATLSIIDLAGSERAAATKNKGKRLTEGANINRSLLALGNCINALCDPKKRNHIPYRDSKLTRLLKFSLGGNCKTVMIVCISPSSQHYDETLNTLKYANRAKEIKTKVIRNSHNLDRHVGSYLKMITEQKQEIEELRSRENKIIEQNISSFKLKKEKCGINMLEAIEKLRMLVQKMDNDLIKKARILVKKKILTLQKLELSLISQSFDINYGSKFVEVPRDIQDIKQLLKTSIEKVDKEISQAEYLFSIENEFDKLLNKNIKISLAKLKELDDWFDYDSLVFNLLVEQLKKDVERQVLQYSEKIFQKITDEKKEETLQSFTFLSNSFFKVFKKLTFINTSEDVDIIRDENLSLLNGMLNDCYESLNTNVGVDQIEKALREVHVGQKNSQGKRLSSPKKLSPHKVRTKSPKKNDSHKVKKVRWDLPNNTIIYKTALLEEMETDEEDEDVEEKDDDDDDDDDDEEEGDSTVNYQNDSLLQNFQKEKPLLQSPSPSKMRRSLSPTKFLRSPSPTKKSRNIFNFDDKSNNSILSPENGIHVSSTPMISHFDLSKKNFNSLKPIKTQGLSDFQLNSSMIDKENIGITDINQMSSNLFNSIKPNVSVSPISPSKISSTKIFDNNKIEEDSEISNKFNFENSFSGDIEMD